jgi:hypothetical protein
MSRDIFVQDLPRTATTVADIPNDFKPRPIGSSDEIIAAIQRVAPDADFSDVEWGVIERATFSIEVNIPRAPSLDAFALHVRGDDAADVVIAQILHALGLRGLDPTHSATGFFESTATPG